MRRQQYHVKLTESEYQLLLQAMLAFRNRVAKENGQTEDLNEILLKLMKPYRKWFMKS